MRPNKSKIVRKYFNSIALKYDLMNTLLSFGIHYLWKQKTIKEGNLKKGSLVIDLCGGTADLSISAGKIIGHKGKVVLYDFSLKMIESGIDKVKKNDLSDRITPVCGNAEIISFPDNTFDTALIGFGLRNLSDIEKGLNDIHRVLKPGSSLICLEFSQPASPWFRRFYDFYSSNILPFAGKIITGSEEAYTYLHDSIRDFPLPDELSQIMRQSGFKKVTYKRLTNGIAVIHIATK
jgi:demethylmenaquinone methyltransferase/2-methoxy-6-polyprenyl-1,4-benzoquinol methylase